MILKEDSVQRLGEIELERAALQEQIELIQEQITMLDKEYIALKGLLSAPRPDGRWVSQGIPILESAYYILKKAGHPLHYMEIYRTLQAELFHMTGNASVANLVVRINRDKRFKKIRRGIYGLSEWGSSGASRINTDHSIISNSKYYDGEQYGALTVAEEREIEKTKFILESVEIDIQVTQNNLTMLRNRLLGHDSTFSFPDNIDPITAISVLKRKLSKLLEQRDALINKLGGHP